MKLGFMIFGLVLCLAVALAFAVSSVITYTPSVNVTSNVKKIEAYLNGTKRDSGFNIDFGTVMPDPWLNSSLDVVDVGNVACTVTATRARVGRGYVEMMLRPARTQKACESSVRSFCLLSEFHVQSWIVFGEFCQSHGFVIRVCLVQDSFRSLLT